MRVWLLTVANPRNKSVSASANEPLPATVRIVSETIETSAIESSVTSRTTCNRDVDDCGATGIERILRTANTLPTVSMNRQTGKISNKSTKHSVKPEQKKKTKCPRPK